MSEEDGARNSGSDLMAMPELVVADDGTVSISEAERQKYQWKYAKIGAGEIKKKLEKKEEDLAKLRKKKKSDPTKDAHLVLVLEMLKEAAAKRIRCEGKLAKRSGVDGGKAPKARMFLLVVTPPYDAAAGPQWTLVPFITLEYYDSKWGAAKGIIELGCDTICTKGDGKTVTTGTGDRFTLSATTGLKIVVQVPEEEMALGKTPDGLRPYWFNCPDETTRDMWYDNVTAVIEEAKTMFEASSKIQATMRGKAERKEFVEKLAAKKSQAVGYTGEALAAAAAKGATLYAVAAPKAQEAYGAMKTQAAAAHVSLEQAVAFKYASEIFMEIDFAAPRPNTKGLALGQLVQWWAATGGVQPSDEDIAAAKAIWEEKDTDGADEGEGLFVDDFCFVVHKMQDAGLLDTAWAAVEKKAAAVGKSWGSCTAASLTVGTAAVYGGAAKASGKANGYLKKAKASAASAVTGSAVYAKAKPKAMAAYDEMHTAAKHKRLDDRQNAKYALEVFMEIDFSGKRNPGDGLAYSQLVQWWAETGGVWPSAQAVAEGKALWEEVDTDGADSGEGLGIEDFCTTFFKFQRAGLLDTAWEALEKKAKGTTRIRVGRWRAMGSAFTRELDRGQRRGLPLTDDEIQSTVLRGLVACYVLV